MRDVITKQRRLPLAGRKPKIGHVCIEVYATICWKINHVATEGLNYVKIMCTYNGNFISEWNTYPVSAIPWLTGIWRPTTIQSQFSQSLLAKKWVQDKMTKAPMKLWLRGCVVSNTAPSKTDIIVFFLCGWYPQQETLETHPQFSMNTTDIVVGLGVKMTGGQIGTYHDDVIKWKQFPRYWLFMWGIHRSPVNSAHKGQWHGCFLWSPPEQNAWVNNREAGNLRRHRAHYGVIVMSIDTVKSNVRI